jgi:hypothetical protein
MRSGLCCPVARVAQPASRQGRRAHALQARHRILPGLVHLGCRRQPGAGRMAVHVSWQGSAAIVCSWPRVRSGGASCSSAGRARARRPDS